MTSSSSVILLEFNELSPSLMSRFMAEKRLPYFQQLYSESHIYTTDAGEDPPNLEPWIQWVTVHSGLSYPEHGIFHLGDGGKLKQKCLWDVLSEAGLPVGVCGSMNTRYDTPINGYVLPDPWSSGTKPYPETLQPYFRFIQSHVQEYTNARVPLSLADHGRFLYFMATHGLSFNTLASIITQLGRERGGKGRWKRAQILDKLQLDLYTWYYQRMKPRFSTFFSNSTAHLQHMYWRNMEPQLFKIKPTPHEQAEFDQAILHGYQEMDGMIGKFLGMAGSDVTLIFCTALSQQPCLIYEDSGGKSFYRPKHFEDLMVFAGITAPHTISPVMSEQFHLYFNNDHDAQDAAVRLRALRLDERSLMSVECNGKTVFAGCSIYTDLPADAILAGAASGRTRPFFDVFYKIEGKKSGMHHRDGMLWIRSPERTHNIHIEKIPITSIAPTILSMFGLSKTPPPASHRPVAQVSHS